MYFHFHKCFEFKSYIEQLYGNKNFIEERHRHRYEINPKYINDLEAAGLKFVGKLTFTF